MTVNALELLIERSVVMVQKTNS